MFHFVTEHEVLLIWAALFPVVANPVVYLTCVTEYRENISQAWKIILGESGSTCFLYKQIIINPFHPELQNSFNFFLVFRPLFQF